MKNGQVLALGYALSCIYNNLAMDRFDMVKDATKKRTLEKGLKMINKEMAASIFPWCDFTIVEEDFPHPSGIACKGYAVGVRSKDTDQQLFIKLMGKADGSAELELLGVDLLQPVARSSVYPEGIERLFHAYRTSTGYHTYASLAGPSSVMMTKLYNLLSTVIGSQVVSVESKKFLSKVRKHLV